MSKTLSCRDAGADCDFVARAETEEKLFEICAKHAKEDHGMDSIPADLQENMRAFIRDE